MLDPPPQPLLLQPSPSAAQNAAAVVPSMGAASTKQGMELEKQFKEQQDQILNKIGER